jgi:hypothetical protein
VTLLNLGPRFELQKVVVDRLTQAAKNKSYSTRGAKTNNMAQHQLVGRIEGKSALQDSSMRYYLTKAGAVSLLRKTS